MDLTSEFQPSQELETAGLARKAIQGDVEAYGELYNLCLYRIYRYIFNQVRNEMQAEDITEEVFIKAWKAIKSCKGKESTFIPWLYRIAHNCLIDNIRKKHLEIPFDMVTIVDEASPEKKAEDRMELQMVLEMVKDLPESQKQVILLKFMDDMDNEEIGRIMGKRQGAVRALQMRALISLREKFGSGVKENGR
jgi:RNA polymerase sigma-70 factor, ECF subfamily